MSSLQLLISITSIFYIMYVLIQLYFIEDEDLMKYEIMKQLSFKDKKDILVGDAKERAIAELSDGTMEGLTHEEQREEIDEATKEYIKLTTDEEYLKDSVKRFGSTIRQLHILRWMKLTVVHFIAHLYLLLPVLTLVATGNVFMTLVTSALVMTYYALIREEYLREIVDEVYGPELTDEVVSSLGVKLSIIGHALLSQSYLFLYIYIILGS